MSASAFDSGYHTEVELRAMGFRQVGENVRIAKGCTIVGLENISIGSNVRIDGFCGIFANGEGFVHLGSFIHIGAWCYLAGGSGIVLEDYSGLSQGVKVYSRSDDYSGQYLTNPTVPEEYTGVKGGEVRICKHGIVGSGSVILPGVTVGEGVAVGALSLVLKSLDPWGIYFGCPVRRIRERSRELLRLEAAHCAERELI